MVQGDLVSIFHKKKAHLQFVLIFGELIRDCAYPHGSGVVNDAVDWGHHIQQCRVPYNSCLLSSHKALAAFLARLRSARPLLTYAGGGGGGSAPSSLRRLSAVTCQRRTVLNDA
jgi:hypothetical protein